MRDKHGGHGVTTNLASIQKQTLALPQLGTHDLNFFNYTLNELILNLSLICEVNMGQGEDLVNKTII